MFDGSHLQDLLAGLSANALLGHTHLLTGEGVRGVRGQQDLP